MNLLRVMNSVTYLITFSLPWILYSSSSSDEKRSRELLSFPLLDCLAELPFVSVLALVDDPANALAVFVAVLVTVDVLFLQDTEDARADTRKSFRLVVEELLPSNRARF